jgi:NADP-dependent 3-hydroxy acid dehydrogenase YdfG
MNKVIVIIGAGSGIAQGVAEKFGLQGFSVALVSRRKEKLEKLTNELIEKGIDAHAFVGDAGDTESMKDAFNQIWEKWEYIDVVHYNVAKIKMVNIASETADGLTRDFKVNVAGVLTVINLVASDMEKKEKAPFYLQAAALHWNQTLTLVLWQSAKLVFEILRLLYILP